MAWYAKSTSVLINHNRWINQSVLIHHKIESLNVIPSWAWILNQSFSIYPNSIIIYSTSVSVSPTFVFVYLKIFRISSYAVLMILYNWSSGLYRCQKQLCMFCCIQTSPTTCFGMSLPRSLSLCSFSRSATILPEREFKGLLTTHWLNHSLNH